MIRQKDNLKTILRITSAFIVVLFLLVATVPSFAANEEIPEDASANVGLSTVNPSNDSDDGEAQTRGTEKPTKIWNIKKKGQYNFSGMSAYHMLYSEYLITGDTWYKVTAKNLKGTGAKSFTMAVYKNVVGPDVKLGSTSVAPQKTKTISTKKMPTSAKIYATFTNPVHASGNIH